GSINVDTREQYTMTRRTLTYFAVILITLILGVSLAQAAAGAPARPSAGASPDPALAVHPLTYAPGPLDNPLKGFMPFFITQTNYEAKPLPHSMLWSYFAL